MSKITVAIIGGDQLKALLERKQKEVDAELKKAVTSSCLLVEKDAKKLCPVDTGRLRSSITHEVLEVTKSNFGGRVGTNVEYAPYIEFGTKRNRKATPFLYFAMQRNFDKIRKLLGHTVVETLNKS